MDLPLPTVTDEVQVFQLESSHLRGRLVRLGPVLDLILAQHAYPLPVAGLLAEAMAIACALAASLKYDGVFTLQAKGDGPVRLLVADVTSTGGVRAYAQFDAAKLAIGELGEVKLLGKGYLAFTVNQEQQYDRYQGVVELKGATLSEVVQHYFRQSEQLPTGIVSSVAQDQHGHWHGGCLMLQQMPRSGGGMASLIGGVVVAAALTPDHDTAVADDWHRAMLLMGTCKPEELTDPALPSEQLLYRLFHEEGVRVYEPQQFRHQCRCSEERVAGMLKSLPRAEIEDLAVNGVVEVTCEFCNRSYSFDVARREELYGGD